jgi:dTMP kinase
MSKFITLEGPEGSGKTTVAKMLLDALRKQGFLVFATRAPGGTEIAEQIRHIILDPRNTAMDPRAEALLYAASRRQHMVEKILPALAKGEHVLCDRFIDSSLAYQGHGRGLGIDEVLQLNLFAIEGHLPDITLFFDVSPEIGLKRIDAHKGREVNRLDLERLEFHHTVREGYLEVIRRYPDRFIVIDANQPLELVFQDALARLVERLK